MRQSGFTVQENTKMAEDDNDERSDNVPWSVPNGHSEAESG